jgi:lipoprotein NlpI
MLFMNVQDMRKDNVTRSTFFGVFIVLAGVLAYSNCYQGGFTFDDNAAIVMNPYVQHLWPLWNAFKAPTHTTTIDRPTVCLINAVNYAVCGLEFVGWRAVNLLIHVLCSLLLFGIVSRTLTHSSSISPVLKSRGPYVAFAVGLFFVVHPLQTQAVNYIVQRTESIMALFYLLTFYCAIRGWQSGRRGWFYAAVMACACGMGSKEVIVSVPITLLMYDRIFNGGSFKVALRRSWGLYAGLAATWVILALLVMNGGSRESAQWGHLKHTAYDYFLTQGEVILYYLRLSVWPRPLCFDYGWPYVHSIGEGLAGVLAVGTLFVAAIYALIHRPTVGFLGFTFFAVLAPSSSFMPLPDAIVEYRMYLPLAVLSVLYVCAGWTLIDSVGARLFSEDRREKRVQLASRIVFASCVVVFASLTYLRNADYHSPVELWGDVVRKRPMNARGHINFGIELTNEVKRQLALNSPATDRQGVEKMLTIAADEMTLGLKLNPDSENTHLNLGGVLAMLGRNQEALMELQAAVKETPGSAAAHFNLANLLSAAGQKEAALQAYATAVAIDPDFKDAHYNLGVDLYDGGKYPEALRQFAEVLRIDPRSSEGHYMTGLIMIKGGQRGDAEAQLKTALSLNPNFEQARNELQKLGQ